MIKALLFDIGGVLVDLEAAVSVKAFKALGFEDIETYLDVLHQRGFISDLEEGVLSEKGFFEACFEHCRPGTTESDVRNAFCSLLTGVSSYKAELIRRLSERFNLYVLSNNNSVTMPFIANLMAQAGAPMDECFTYQFLSYQMKCLKPGREIFERTIASIGLPADEILYIDDSPRNVAGGAAVGLRSIWYDPKTDLRDALRGIDPVLDICL